MRNQRLPGAILQQFGGSIRRLFAWLGRNKLAIAAHLILLLFLYAAESKLFSFDFYLADLQRSPLLKSIAIPLSITVPGAEILLAILLFIPKTRKLGFAGSSILMTIFTVYVAWVLGFSDERPCTCGGIIRQLSWGQHLILNVCFTALAYWGFAEMQRKQPVTSPEPENDVSLS